MSQNSAVHDSNTAGSRLLSTSLQRLYDSNDGQSLEPTAVPTIMGFPSGTPEYDLSASLLEAVFEISDFDPLPQLYRQHGNFGTADFGTRETEPGSRVNHRHDSPAQPSVRGGAWPHGRSETSRQVHPSSASGAGIDRRKLPRRESECLVAVHVCTTEERLTGDRIAWLLHATQLKGTLIDVSMSGISFCLPEPLAADAKILLRISNRTIDEHVDATASVLRSRETDEGEWSVVCRFNKNLTFGQIHVVGRSLFAATIV